MKRFGAGEELELAGGLALWKRVVDVDYPTHTDSADELFLLLSGRSEFVVEGERITLSPGEALLVEAGERHSHRTKGELLLASRDGSSVVGALARERVSVREYLAAPVPDGEVKYAINAALQAPSGANRCPWRFCVVKDPPLKAKIRERAEEVEKAFYAKLNEDSNLAKQLGCVGATWKKPHLTDAPLLVVLFGERGAPYWRQSVWLAAGWFMLALQERGLASLTYTPAPSVFLCELLGYDPKEYSAEVLFPVGRPAAPKEKLPRRTFEDAVKWVGEGEG